ncbi:MAG: hypothetical protein AAFR61_12190 [Bacteroidota bacterium]
MSDKLVIACPKCEWEPDGGAYWMCSCGHTWNTFATLGQCPACGRKWEHTQCIQPAGGCNAWSPHLDWYRDLDSFVQKEVSQILAPKQLTLDL